MATKNTTRNRTASRQVRAGMVSPGITTGPIDQMKTRVARAVTGSGGGFGVGPQRSRMAAVHERTAGMLIDNVQTSRAFLSGYALEAYRTSFANGLNNRSGTYDVPGYFVQMNQQNGGILYWPVTLQEKYQWFRYFARTEPYVGRALDLLCDLPMSKLTLNMPKMPGKEKLRQEILEFYTYQMERVNAFELGQNILFELNCIGNVYLFHEYDEKNMMWSRVVMLPPEEVYSFQLPFSDNRRIEYRPERLMALIKADGREMVLGQSGLSEDIISNIPPDLVDMVRREGCIVMDSDPMSGSFCAHLARRKQPYMDLGSSLLERVLIALLQKEHYRYTQLSLASRNMTPKNLITAPGLQPFELDELRTQVDLSYLDPDYTIMANFEVEWNQIGAQDRLLQLDSEYERIENQIFASMGVTRELMTGEGTYSGNKITVEILNTMFLLSREVLKSYFERQMFIPLAERHGWFETNRFGAKKYYAPEIGFNRLTIRDNQEVFESLFQLYQKGSLNVDVIYELFNLNGDQVREKLLEDVFTVKDPTFNRMLEEVHSDVGRSLRESTDVMERIAKNVGLKMKPQPQQAPGGEGGEGEEGFGGFGGESAPADAPTLGEAVSGEGTSEEPEKPSETPAPETPAGKPSLEEVADAVAESLPVDADEKDIADVVDAVTKDEEPEQ